MIDKSRTGHTYRSYRYEVSRAKIEEYARATGYDLSPAPDGAPLVAPNIFAACFTVMYGASLLRGDERLGGAGAIVHAGQEYTFHRQVSSGEVLRCTPTITGIVDRGAHTYLTLEIACVDDVTSESVVTSGQTIAYLGAATP